MGHVDERDAPHAEPRIVGAEERDAQHVSLLADGLDHLRRLGGHDEGDRVVVDRHGGDLLEAGVDVLGVADVVLPVDDDEHGLDGAVLLLPAVPAATRPPPPPLAVFMVEALNMSEMSTLKPPLLHDALGSDMSCSSSAPMSLCFTLRISSEWTESQIFANDPPNSSRKSHWILHR